MSLMLGVTRPGYFCLLDRNLRLIFLLRKYYMLWGTEIWRGKPYVHMIAQKHPLDTP